MKHIRNYLATFWCWEYFLIRITRKRERTCKGVIHNYKKLQRRRRTQNKHNRIFIKLYENTQLWQCSWSRNKSAIKAAQAEECICTETHFVFVLMECQNWDQKDQIILVSPKGYFNFHPVVLVIKIRHESYWQGSCHSVRCQLQMDFESL